MSATRLIAILLLVTVSGVLVQPARAEAIEPNVVLLLVGVGVAVIIVVVVVIIANVRESQRGTAAETPVRLVAELQGN
jgi:hypothetical protein